MTIWVLYSIANDYDQPSDNMVSWWREKPNALTLVKEIGCSCVTEEITHIVDYPGQSSRINETDYRLEKVAEGIHVKEK